MNNHITRAFVQATQRIVAYWKYDSKLFDVARCVTLCIAEIRIKSGSLDEERNETWSKSKFISIDFINSL
jgi:hypothetical protein